MLFVSKSAWAHSWNEPWHQYVVKNAVTFVKAKTVKVSGSEASFALVKNLAGVRVTPTFTVTGLSHQHLNIGAGDTVYLFLAEPEDVENPPDQDAKPNKDAGAIFALITPTASVAKVLSDGVVAVYRHSYHAALVSPELYEWTQRAIFNRSMLEAWDEERVRKYISAELAKPPGPLETHTDSDFFRQHIAMELLVHQAGAGMASKEVLALLEPYLRDSGFHPQISAARALGAVAGEASTERLLRFIENADREGFAKVMAVWALERRRTKKVQKRLEAYRSQAETDELGFGGGIMDPRIGTYFPQSVQDAIAVVMDEWGPLSTAPDVLESPAPESKATNSKVPAKHKVKSAPPQVSAKKVGCASCSSSGTSLSASLPFLVLLLCLYRRPKRDL